MEEIELKLLVPQGALEEVQRQLNAWGLQPAVRIETVYFDTADGQLAARNCSLRVRRREDGSGAHWVQTLKNGDALAALSHRQEWEASVPGPRPRLAGLPDSPLQALLGDGPVRLVPLFRTRFQRTERTVQFGGALIEVAFDEGRISAGRTSEPIRELELELRDGPVTAVFDLALQLAGRGNHALALLPAPESKAWRGRRLAQRVARQPVHSDGDALPGLLQRQAHRRDSDPARRIVAHSVQTVLANVQGAALGEDVEYVHQTRVALRRARAALRALGAGRGADNPVGRDLRWMADCFGAVRDWDVMLSHTLPSLLEATAQDPARRERLLQRAQAHRERQQLRLSGILHGARFARVALCLLRWAEASSAPAALPPPQPALKFARANEKLIAAAGDLKRLPPRKLHRLRILAKRQRYALELLASEPHVQGAKRMLRTLVRLQQLLGRINDAHMALAALPSLTRSRAVRRAAQQWCDEVVRRTLPKVRERLQRLAQEEREGLAS